MPIINLRKYYYPTIQKDAFVEVSGEVAEALEEGLRIERRQEKKKLYHKVFSMDTNDWTRLHISVYAQSPEDVLLQAEDRAEQERNLSRMTEAFARLTPTQARRIRARYMGGKKLREIGESEGTGESEAGHSVRSGIRRMRRYFIQQKWLKAQKPAKPLPYRKERNNSAPEYIPLTAGGLSLLGMSPGKIFRYLR